MLSMNSDEVTSHAIKIVIAVLTWVAARYLPPDVGASLSQYIPTIAAGVVALGAFAYGVYLHWNQKSVPENSTALQLPAGAAPPVGAKIDLAPLTGLAKVVGALLVSFLLLQFLTTSVFAAASTPVFISEHDAWLASQKPQPQKPQRRIMVAQTAAPAASPPIIFSKVKTAAPATPAAAPAAKITTAQAQQNPLLVLQQFSAADLQNALNDANAQTPPDTVSAACWSALLTLVNNPINNPLPTAPGAFLLFQKARDLQGLLANLQSPSGPLAPVNTACAPLILSAQNTLIQLGIIGGGVTAVGASGGLALPAMPLLASLLAILPK